MTLDKMAGKIVKKLCLVTLMGLPASGKSTLADAIKSSFEDCADTLCIILRFDDFVPLEIQQLKEYLGSDSSSGYNNSGYCKTLRKNFILSAQWLASSVLNSQDTLPDLSTVLSPDANHLVPVKDFITKIESAFELFKKEGIESYSKGFIVIDDNNYYRSMRNELYQIAKKLECSLAVLYLNCSTKDAIQRNSDRPPQFRIPTQAIEEMSKKLEEPNPMENPCDLFCVQINSGNNPAEASTSTWLTKDIDASVKALLEHSLLNPVVYVPPPDRSEDRRVCSENEIHQADLVLRKWITSQLTISSFTTNFNSSKNRRAQSQELSLKKCLVLDNLRKGVFKVTAQVTQDVEFRNEILNFMHSVQLANSNPSALDER